MATLTPGFADLPPGRTLTREEVEVSLSILADFGSARRLTAAAYDRERWALLELARRWESGPLRHTRLAAETARVLREMAEEAP